MKYFRIEGSDPSGEYEIFNNFYATHISSSFPNKPPELIYRTKIKFFTR
jgi:hypothetical protein